MRGSSWLAVLVVAVGLLAAPGLALAGYGPVATEPAAGTRVEAPPQTVRLVLPTRVEQEFLELRVTGPDGRLLSGAPVRDPRDPRAIVVPLDAPSRGVLDVTWRVLSEDGHGAGGAYAIGVRADPPAGPSAAAVTRSDHGAPPVLARLLSLVGPLGLIGLLALAAGVVAPAVAAGGIVVPGEKPAVTEGFRARAAAAIAPSARAWWTAWWALVAATAAGLALAPLATLWVLREGPGEIGPLIGGTRFGVAWRVQVAGLVIAVVGALVARRLAGGRALPERAGLAAALGVGPALALAAISWGGHASAGGDATANIVIDLLHSGATAAWIGGLLGLAVLVAPAVARLGEGDRVRLAASVVVRFSALAMVAVVVLVVTGVYRALAEVSVGELLDTGYGRALLVKLALFAVLLLGGAYNRMIVHPRLERAALGLDPTDRGAASALRVSVRAELALAAALLVVVAVLVSLPPPG